MVQYQYGAFHVVGQVVVNHKDGKTLTGDSIFYDKKKNMGKHSRKLFSTIRFKKLRCMGILFLITKILKLE
jgi:lipopolysaccharide export system protein LptA